MAVTFNRVNVMAGRPEYAGRRSVFPSGDSLVVSLPAKEMESAGIDAHDLEGKEVHARLDQDGTFTVDLDSVENSDD